MAPTVGSLPAGSRITDYISLGVIAKIFPGEKVREVLEETKRASRRERDLPAHVVDYVVALALYMRSSYWEVLRCLLGGGAVAIASVGHRQGGGQIGDLASPQPTGDRTAEEAVRDRRGPDR